MVEALALAAWLYLALLHGRFWRVRSLLQPSASPPDSARSKRVAVVIPARDEAGTIGAVVGALRAQNWTGLLRLFVIDDGSTDGTGEIARRHGATVIEAGPLPQGWTGKMWAVSRGVDAAMTFQPDYLLFTDADIIHGPASVGCLVARAETEHRDLVSVMAKLRCESFAERLVVPAFVFLFFMLYPPAWIARRDRRVAGAAGGCVLVRPEALERAGGIRGIRSELIDDCALAAAVKRTGGSLWLGLSEEVRSVRAYGTFGELRAMISRTAFTQLRYSAWLLAGTLLGLALLFAVPVVRVSTIAGGLAWVTMALLYLPMVRYYRLPAWHALVLPAVAGFYALSTVDSAIRYWRGMGGGWKGRHQAVASEEK